MNTFSEYCMVSGNDAWRCESFFLVLGQSRFVPGSYKVHLRTGLHLVVSRFGLDKYVGIIPSEFKFIHETNRITRPNRHMLLLFQANLAPNFVQ